MPTTIRMGEFFSGPGGMALGARDAARRVNEELGLDFEVQHLWANDFDADTESTYRANINPVEFKPGDVREVVAEDLTDIDGFAFGFPCNDFSSVGEYQGLNGPYGQLYKQGIEVLRRKQPSFFVAENVTGLLSANDGKAYYEIITEMHRAGYNLFPHTYNFELYGVPQKRRRVIIVGFSAEKVGDLKFKIPAPSTPIPITAGEALRDIPEDAPNHSMPKHPERVRRRLEHIQPGQNAFNADLPAELKLKVKGATLSNIYRRLEKDKPSYTVTGSGGGGTHVYHWDEPRALTNRERARLQTFPDWFEFKGGPASVRRQIGMAVPVKGAEAVFTAIFRTLAGRDDYPAVEANRASRMVVS